VSTDEKKRLLALHRLQQASESLQEAEYQEALDFVKAVRAY